MSVAEAIISTLRDRGMTMALAESLTGGLLVAELIAVPGASHVVRGGVVAYDTAIKQTVLGVDADLLAEHGPVHPEVARQMADRVRTVLAVNGKPADVGLSTTGVAGPGAQGEHPAGTVYVGFALGGRVFAELLQLEGDREAIRKGTVSESLVRLHQELATA
ncbi:CinA family protein [Lacisediminihabitans changchengi]|uniref:Nicotinamide-nucleotide amidohydrolase family protein n=1 Tax=Lacisediminihabitans changchengi TaxID=2787634 RepID=A0A934SLK5_9MICO|nr:nicotinamide-nucleotide amidohydrolase family protein [Lacisediminihabitans changchengi]MBK4347604.1 nicotinamide-nucleotide amidohydrolase family protein [Lacisediminihabitans changchengi]